MAARDDDVNFTAASEPLSAVLVEFFRKVAAGDEEIYDQLRSRFKSQVSGDRFHFTLPELYAFMTEQYEMFRDVDYRRFRKALFKAPINAALQPMGALVVIIENKRKVDQTLYALERRSSGP